MQPRDRPAEECACDVGPDSDAPEVGDDEWPAGDPAALALGLANPSINVVDFEITEPVRRISIRDQTTHVEDAGDGLPVMVAPMRAMAVPGALPVGRSSL